tara:strand:- start:385 stop:609 length:225 start_codon:yes stop_codon:yes gene_type:complete
MAQRPTVPALAETPRGGGDGGLLNPRMDSLMRKYWQPHESQEQTMDSLAEKAKFEDRKAKAAKRKERRGPKVPS